MKLPKAVVTLAAVFSFVLLCTGIFAVYAIRRRSFLSAIAAVLSAVSSIGLASVIEDYCRTASFQPREYLSFDRAIRDFFMSPGQGIGTDIHD